MKWLEAYRRKTRVAHQIKDAENMFPLEPTRSLMSEQGIDSRALLDHLKTARDYPVDSTQWELVTDALHTINSYLGLVHVYTTVLGLTPERLSGLEAKLGKVKQLTDFMTENPASVWGVQTFNLWTTGEKTGDF